MLSIKQGGIKYHFLSLRYDSTRDWTPVSQTIKRKLYNWVKHLHDIASKVTILIPSSFIYEMSEGYFGINIVFLG